MMLPSHFTARIHNTFPREEAEAFLTAIAAEPAVSIRLHPKKKWDGTFADMAPVSWHTQGRYLGERPAFIFDLAFHAGAYYVQESSSMFLQKALEKIELPKQAVVLDLCAAPGGKSTLLLSELPPGALLVANEVIRTRIPALKENIRRWGYPNVVVTHADPADFKGLPGVFDLLVVDAPCSGEGLFRKDPEAIKHWSPEALQTCELRQQRILRSAVPLLKNGGYLLYSTCTFNPGENEGQIRELLEDGFESVPVLRDGEFPEIRRIPIGENGVGYAFYPHRVKGEGFFLSLLRKTVDVEDRIVDLRPRKPFFDKPAKSVAGVETWMENPDEYVWKEKNGTIYAIPKTLEKQVLMVASSVPTVYAGLAAGEYKGHEFIPDHALALSNIIGADIPHIELEEQDALRFLKKESIRSHELSKGLYAVRYKGLNLGWVKAVPGRLNNLLPMEFRIRKNVAFD